jgi:uncharacterized repeat protein (TIGR01451 family)
VAITILGNNGSGTDDNWPAAFPATGFADNGDQFADTVTLTVGMPVIYFLSQVDKPTAAPGETLTYTMTYDNDGSDSTASAGGGALLVRQLLPKFVRYVATTLDYATAIHAGGGIAQFSSIALPGTFNQTGAWADANPDSVAGFEVSYDTDIAADDTTGDAGTDLLGSADGTIPDPDAGQVTFKVIVK